MHSLTKVNRCQKQAAVFSLFSLCKTKIQNTYPFNMPVFLAWMSTKGRFVSMDTKGPCNLMVYGECNITVCSAYYDQRSTTNNLSKSLVTCKMLLLLGSDWVSTVLRCLFELLGAETQQLVPLLSFMAFHNKYWWTHHKCHAQSLPWKMYWRSVSKSIHHLDHGCWIISTSTSFFWLKEHDLWGTWTLEFAYILYLPGLLLFLSLPSLISPLLYQK